MEDQKPWWASKTIWVNLVALGATLATVLGVDTGLTPEVQTQIVAGVMGIVNIVLRFVTTTPVGK